MTPLENEARLPAHITHLCIEGVIGVGKTSLCQRMADYYNARLVLEHADANPFLQHFYQARDRFAFQTQLWFLLSRFQQMSEELAQQNLFYSATITDYLFAKDSIFARINLSEPELALYEQIFGLFTPRIAAPDCVVYLQASTETLVRRIKKRGRSYEQHIDQDYIETLNNAYNQFFFNYTDSPLLIINTNALDFVENDNHFEELIEQIVTLKSGTHFYQPLGDSLPGKTRRTKGQ
ncbi:MAG: deoxynucleoside kinase [Chitinivibrionales bacterium]|nr:deoxynucleoside kinase [Chitinivibrionales bacterium]